jgi:hypothetical protein
VLHSDFYVTDTDEVDIVLVYSWIESVCTININVQKKFLKLWYKKMLHIIFVIPMIVNDVNLSVAFRGVSGLSS